MRDWETLALSSSREEPVLFSPTSKTFETDLFDRLQQAETCYEQNDFTFIIVCPLRELACRLESKVTSKLLVSADS